MRNAILDRDVTPRAGSSVSLLSRQERPDDRRFSVRSLNIFQTSRGIRTVPRRYAYLLSRVGSSTVNFLLRSPCAIRRLYTCIGQFRRTPACELAVTFQPDPARFQCRTELSEQLRANFFFFASPTGHERCSRGTFLIPLWCNHYSNPPNIIIFIDVSLGNLLFSKNNYIL